MLKKIAVLALAGLVSLAHHAIAQDFRAKLAVTVTDPSGKSVPGASLELRNVTNVEVLHGTTNISGIYTFLFVQPGTYTLKVSATGFRPAQREGITLQSYQSSGIDVVLEIGAVTESVTVSAEAALLETESASRGVVVNTTMVSDLPVNNKNPLMLGQYLPGVYMRPLGIYTQPWTVTSQFMVNGGLMYLNEFQVDGAPNNAMLGGNIYGYTPPNETVQEVSIQANSYDAQYGRTSGGVINVSTKSGTTEFHATAWTYLQRPGWRANSFQNNAIGAGRTSARQDQWGFQVSGPVYVPKLIPKSDNFRMFFLFAFDIYDTKLPNPLRLSYPEPEMRTGDFSRLVNAAGQRITIYDPFTTRFDAAGNPIRSPFPGNIIPADRLNPVAKAVTQYMPQPNAKTPGVRYATNNLLLPNNLHYWDFHNWMPRVDFNIGPKHRLFVRPARMRFGETSNYNGITGPGIEGGTFARSNWAGLLDWIYTMRPTVVVNLRANASRYGEGWTTPPNRGFDLAKLGLPASLLSQVAQPALFGRWEFTGYAGMGRAENWNNTNTYSLQGSVSKFAGPHNIRSGFDLRQTNFLDFTTGSPLYFVSTRGFTRREWNQSSSETDSGDAFASFLLGVPSTANAEYHVRPWYRSWYFAPWIQDDWKVNRRLTLNAGLRFDLNVPPTEKYNRMNVGFDPTLANPVAGMIPSNMLQRYPSLRDLKGGLQFAGVGGNRRNAMNTDWGNFQPRVGFAFQVFSKLVLRGGYGLYYTNFQSNSMMRTYGFSNTTSAPVSLDDGRTPIPNLLSNPFPGGIQKPAGAAMGALTYVGRTFSQYNQDYKLPHVHQFSFGFQFLATPNSVLDISYVGSRTRDYSANLNANLPSWEFARQCDVREGGRRSYCDEALPNPFQGIEAFRGTTLFSSPTVSRFHMARPFPQFNGDITIQGMNLGKLWYNGLQINFNRRLSYGLVLNANYVWSKQIEQWGWMDEYRLIPQRSNYFVDHPHVFKLSGTYDLPFGKGRPVAVRNRVLDAIIGGWQIAPALFIQNGERADLPSNALRLRDSRVRNINWDQHQVRGWGACVLNVNNNGEIAPMSYSVQRYGCSATDFSNYDWIVYPILTGQRVSPSGAGDLRMKPYINVDMAASKTLVFAERLRLQFRAEAMNAINHLNYLTARFNTNPTDPNFGTSFPAFTPGLDAPPRVLQLGLKLMW